MMDKRKQTILLAVTKDYIATAEPVGSRSIVKHYRLGISPATARNEMADLEESGYLTQPHTSAGRIPSDKGYRFYVDVLMDAYELTKEERDTIILRMEQKRRDVESLITGWLLVAIFVRTPPWCSTDHRVRYKHISLLRCPATECGDIVATPDIENRVVDVGYELSSRSEHHSELAQRGSSTESAVEHRRQADPQLAAQISRYTSLRTAQMSSRRRFLRLAMTAGVSSKAPATCCKA